MALPTINRDYPEISPDIMEKIFKEYWIDGYNVVNRPVFRDGNTVHKSFMKECVTKIIFRKFNLKLTNEIGFLIIVYSDIHQFEVNCNQVQYRVIMNLKCGMSKPFVFIEFENKWHRCLLEQCSVRLCDWDGPQNSTYRKCNNIIISGGNGSHSQYSNLSYGCCVRHVVGMKLKTVKGYNYSCRCCKKCVNEWRPQMDTNIFFHTHLSCAIGFDGFNYSKDRIYKSMGDESFACFLRNEKRLKLNHKHRLLKRIKNPIKIKTTPHPKHFERFNYMNVRDNFYLSIL